MIIMCHGLHRQLFKPIAGRVNVQVYCTRTQIIRSLATTGRLLENDARPASQLVKAYKSKALTRKLREPGDLQHFKMPDEDPFVPKKHVFQQLRQVRTKDPVFTLEQAAQYVPPDFLMKSFKYPTLTDRMGNYWFDMRSYDNEFSVITQFPDLTDFLVVGCGLVGSAAAYYMKKTVSRCCDVLAIDKDPYGSNSATAICPGLISCQSKSRDIWRMAQLSKELIRNLRRDLLVTEEDYAKIKYRPCTHLILWSESEAEDAFAATSAQIEDGCFTESKLPVELEQCFPWLKVVDSDVVIGTHGIQDEALIDPIGLRNLYRTLAQAHGANFVQGEMIDFNTQHIITSPSITNFSASSVVVRMTSGELRACSVCKTLLSCGHNVPFLEAQSEMEEEIRDSIQDLHFLQPRLRICIIFSSLAAPIINFPVITDTDGSMLLRDDYAGSYKYYLTSDECEAFFEEDNERFMDLESNDPYVALFHKDELFKVYFNNIVKPKLVSRIPVMEDAKFIMAHTGFESHNTHDGNPIISMHPFHIKIQMAGGFGRRLSTLGPAAGAAMSELMLEEEPETFDVTNFYWDRVIKGRKVEEFSKLLS